MQIEGQWGISTRNVTRLDVLILKTLVCKVTEYLSQNIVMFLKLQLLDASISTWSSNRLIIGKWRSFLKLCTQHIMWSFHKFWFCLWLSWSIEIVISFLIACKLHRLLSVINIFYDGIKTTNLFQFYQCKE